MSKPTKTSIANSGNGPSTKRNDVATKRIIKPKNPATTSSDKKSSIPTKNASKAKEEDDNVKKKSTQPNQMKSQILKPRSFQPAPKPKLPNTLKTRPEAKPQPLRAKHNPEIVNRLKETQPRSMTKNMVLNSTHNVTVSSPPPVRRETVESINVRERTKTRTLEPDEIVILKQKEIGPKSLDTGMQMMQTIDQNFPKETVKEPVAFDINFEEKSKTSKEKPKEKQKITEPPEESDFESYESDFETGSSTSVEDSQSSGESDPGSAESPEPESSDDASEETQLPITVIHKDDERKLDSGNYDMSLRRQKLLQHHLQQLDSNSEQLDSGISYSALSNHSEKTTPDLNPIKQPAKISKRGQELMKKIELDEITFTLFDLEPIKYETFMKMYGESDTTQSATQTNEDRLEAVTQTEIASMKSMWTQHPPQFDLKFMRENDYRNQSNFCGEFEEKQISREILQDPLSQSLNEMKKLQENETRKPPKSKPIDFNRLNEFLQGSALTIASILNKKATKKTLHTSNIPITSGFYNLDSTFLNATNVTQIFSNSKTNLLIMIHDDVESLYSGDFRNLLSVWNVNEPKKPFKLLSTWSEICRVEICPELQDIVIAGLQDGSLAMWDLKESYSFGVKFGSDMCYFAPTQTITPCPGGAEYFMTDVGTVIDLKTFRSNQTFNSLQTYRPVQIASLNDIGTLTIWTIIEIHNNNNGLSPITNQLDESKMEYNSPGARYKLTQSAICNIRDFFDRKPGRLQTNFEKTRSYFENDLFSDEALRELQGNQGKLQEGLTGLRFTGLDVGIERIYVSTNRNFILSCTKTLKTERFRKITFENSKGLFATALRLLWNEEFLTVGFSNGSVMIYNCSQQEFVSELSLEHSEISSKCSTPLVPMSETVEFESSKSCAIQNIIRNERNSYPDRSSARLKDTNRSFDSGLESSAKPLDLRIFDKQIILSGSVLRKDLVNTIELTNDGMRLLALMDGNLRIYDFSLNSEIVCNANDRIKEICLTKETGGNQNLAVLTKDQAVQIHVMK